MNFSKVKFISAILYILVGTITILEFVFIKGMFTAPLMIFLVAVSGIISIILEVKDKKYIYALNYLISSIALCMGYISLM